VIVDITGFSIIFLLIDRNLTKRRDSHSFLSTIFKNLKIQNFGKVSILWLKMLVTFQVMVFMDKLPICHSLKISTRNRRYPFSNPKGLKGKLFMVQTTQLCALLGAQLCGLDHKKDITGFLLSFSNSKKNFNGSTSHSLRKR
jgi:hypothetical protein